ncbi:hypothetical protein RFI_15153 [Reticulomyxa filosa]|uniref:Uncharacterized protein n=1 Tax=Reticulomyxa filosa TaxID=46433 RepID=X6N7Z8_RETFI|nr:hypothetical protein RFI_15153 [Reticulomyxa filosa]|eukprot:ETO22048.1 hypothetical protein RFI_15153 [Reticulomyxa filosa]
MTVKQILFDTIEHFMKDFSITLPSKQYNIKKQEGTIITNHHNMSEDLQTNLLQSQFQNTVNVASSEVDTPSVTLASLQKQLSALSNEVNYLKAQLATREGDNEEGMMCEMAITNMTMEERLEKAREGWIKNHLERAIDQIKENSLDLEGLDVYQCLAVISAFNNHKAPWTSLMLALMTALVQIGGLLFLILYDGKKIDFRVDTWHTSELPIRFLRSMFKINKKKKKKKEQETREERKHMCYVYVRIRS